MQDVKKKIREELLKTGDNVYYLPYLKEEILKTIEEKLNK